MKSKPSFNNDATKAMTRGNDVHKLGKLADLLPAADLLAKGGKSDEARAMYDRAWTGLQGELGPDHPDTLERTFTLGCLLRVRSKLVEAKVMLELHWQERKRPWDRIIPVPSWQSTT